MSTTKQHIKSTFHLWNAFLLSLTLFPVLFPCLGCVLFCCCCFLQSKTHYKDESHNYVCKIFWFQSHWSTLYNVRSNQLIHCSLYVIRKLFPFLKSNLHHLCPDTKWPVSITHHSNKLWVIFCQPSKRNIHHRWLNHVNMLLHLFIQGVVICKNS